MSLGCRFPDLYGTDGCCMCGNPDLQACPCTEGSAKVPLQVF